GPVLKTQTSTPDRLCTPVSMNEGTGWLGFKTGAAKNGPHLYCYRIGPRISSQTVKTADQLGYDTLRILRAERLCVASAKTKQKQATAPAKPTNLSNYLCYAVRALDRPLRRYTSVNLDDQFWTTRTGIAVLRAEELCTPARTSGLNFPPSPVPDSRAPLVAC